MRDVRDRVVDDAVAEVERDRVAGEVARLAQPGQGAGPGTSAPAASTSPPGAAPRSLAGYIVLLAVVGVIALIFVAPIVTIMLWGAACQDTCSDLAAQASQVVAVVLVGSAYAAWAWFHVGKMRQRMETDPTFEAPNVWRIVWQIVIGLAIVALVFGLTCFALLRMFP